jgi:hypothetical protein
VLSVVLVTSGVVVIAGWRMPRSRTFLPIPWSLALLVCGYLLARDAPDDRRVVLGSAVLTLCEVGIIAALATLFAAFSSPFLTAIFTFSVFLIGRSADSLARLPVRVFGTFIKQMGDAASRVVPNLMVYVPPRPLLTGEAANVELGSYLALAAVQALAWAALLLAAASLIFRRRDFL